MPHISVVSPVYKAEDILDELVRRLINELSKITHDFEILLVDDGSPDNSWQKIEEECQKDSRIKGIKLSRNFGQHYAISAGLDNSNGEWIIVMDCDLQDKPEEIYKLYNKAVEGYDIVLAKRINRQDSFIKKILSKYFYAILSYLSGIQQDYTIANFGIYKKKVIDTIRQMRESIRYFPSMIKWVGFKFTKIDIEHSKRQDGKSSYNYKQLINLALDIMLAYSDKPLKLTVKTGLTISFFAFIFAILNVVRAMRGEIEILGYASLIVSIWLLAGFIIFILGVIGLYIGKTFEGVKNRPIYIIREVTWKE